ncbi:MAG: glycosyltransferase, exosortase A system-associated [Gammaproteobacteria bacterium]|nr:glycosyltransferase, exosortase A system-associated [Gammaproteobacteria bacterium]
MKILHVLDHSIPVHSGYAVRSRRIIEYQRCLGWETHHITSARHPHPQSDFETVDELDFFRTRAAFGKLGNLPIVDPVAVIAGLRKRLDDAIEQVAPDVLHAHSPCLNGVAAVLSARRHNLPCVYEVRAFWEDAAVDHGTSRTGSVRYRLTRALENYVFRRCSAVTAICEGLRAEIESRNVTSDIITVIPNAVDPDVFSNGAGKKQKLAQELGLQGKLVLGFLGSFYHYEGLALLVDAINQLALKDHIAMLLVGGGPEEQRLKRHAQSLTVPVAFTGRVPLEAVDEYYNLVDVCVYPRLSMRLTELVTPLKPLEAMAKNRIVVASDVGGHKELIRDGETGFLFQAGSAGALAACLDKVLSSLDTLDTIRTTANQFVRDERTWKKSVARYEEVYARVQNVSRGS